MKQAIDYFTSSGTGRVPDMVVFSLALTVLVCLVQLLRLSPFLKRRFTQSVQQAGLRNAQGEYPVLISTKKDRGKSHSLIITVKNMGISVPDFNGKVERLQTPLNGKIYCMEYGRKTTYTLLYFLPQKYVLPTYLFPADEAIGKMSVQRLINLLVIEATGTGKTVVIKIIITTISIYQPTAKIWMLNFKQIDFPNFLVYPATTDIQIVCRILSIIIMLSKSSRKRGERMPLIILLWMSGGVLSRQWVKTEKSGQGITP